MRQVSDDENHFATLMESSIFVLLLTNFILFFLKLGRHPRCSYHPLEISPQAKSQFCREGRRNDVVWTSKTDL